MSPDRLAPIPQAVSAAQPEAGADVEHLHSEKEQRAFVVPTVCEPPSLYHLPLPSLSTCLCPMASPPQVEFAASVRDSSLPMYQHLLSEGHLLLRREVS